MKRFRPFLPALPICLLLLLLLWHSQTPPASETNTTSEVAVSTTPATDLTKISFPGRRASAPAASSKIARTDLTEIKLPKRADLRWSEMVTETVFEDFRRWTENLRVAGTGVDLKQGIKLAQQRRHALLALIEKNPRRALELAVPASVQQQLPEEIVALLEERVDAQGDLLVQSTTLDNDRGCMTTREATLQDGQVFDVHTYGRRSAMPTRDNIAIHGVALDGKLALSDLSGRVLEPTEIASRLAVGRVMEECPDPPGVEHQTTAADELVIAMGDTRMSSCRSESHAIAALLDAEGAEQSGATAASAGDLDGVIAATPWTEGQKTLLIIRVDFPDAQGQVVSDATLTQLIVDMNAIYTDMSCGKSSYALLGQGSTITPTVRMPKSSSNYASWTSLSKVLDDARAAATAAGYNYLNYTHEVVVTGPLPVVAGTAGVARVGARGAWLHNSQWNLKTCAHEVGHNFGLPHSAAWDTDDGSVIGTGEVWDYGNVFDTMGVGSSPHSSRHFGASLKEFLDWMPITDVVKITTNGSTTTRIRAMDKVQADGNKRALVVDRTGSSDDYWIEHRQLYSTSYGMRDGVLVNWASINGGYQQPLLLDMRPDTSEKTDAVLPIGKTFSDTAAGIHITPVARGTDTDGVNWIDVTVNRGITTGNLQPVATLSATNSNPAISASVTFTCTASDPNGDTLAYFWDWGNGTTTATNSPTASKSWPTAGTYVVQCTISDMKGLTTKADSIVQVGATGFFIEGMVKTIQGNPLQGIVVTASPTTLKATSDATGRYIITGLAAGTYTLTVSSGTPDGFTNPVTVGPSLQDRNFVRQSYSLTWDANTGVSGAQDGVGTWATATGNWYNQTTATNSQWSNASLDSATFGAGTDGTYAVTLSGTPVAGGGIAFNNSGYTLSGSALSLVNGSLDGAITVAAGKTATISSAITYVNNAAASITVNSGAVLNLGGGASNSQYNFLGSGGTVNMTAGTYTANVGSISVSTFHQTGGTFNITPGNNNGYNVSSSSRNVNFSLSGGSLTVNGNAVTPTVNNAYLGIGNGTAVSNTSTMTLKTGATVNVGTTASRSGEIRISNTPESNGTLDVQGGTITIGTGDTANKIYFFKAGTIDAPYLARMSQSGGTVTANGIQFGGASGTYDAASSAVLQLSGGSLYVGAQGITRGSAAGDLAVAIQLQGGTLGADQNWSSSLDMQLGSAAGAMTIAAQSSGGTARNITLSGILSDDSAVNGALTKTGTGNLTLSNANTFTGATAINTGTLVLGHADAVSTSSSLTIADGAALSLTTTPSKVKALTFTNTGTLNFGVAGGGTGLTVSNSNGITNSGAAGSITINITGSAPANGIHTLVSYSGSLQGSGFSAYTLGNTPAGKSYTLVDSGSAVQLVVANAYTWTGAQSSEWSTATIPGSKNWTLDGSPADYPSEVAVIFDSTATNKIVDITGADVTPKSVLFNSGAYTLQGSNKIASPALITVATAATLKLGSSNLLPDGAGTGNLTINGILDLNGKSDTINALTGSGSVDNTAATTISTLAVGANAGGTFSGALKNTGGTLALTKTGSTDVILGGTNTYSGGTTINAGRLFISNSLALAPNGAVQINNGASLILNAGGTPAFAQSITLNSVSNLSLRQAATLSKVILPTSGGVIFNNDDVTTQALSLASSCTLDGSLNVQVGGGSGAPGTVTLTGILSGGGGSLVKTGSGQLSLGGANTFGGGVTLKNGTLESKTTTTTLGTGRVTMGGIGSNGATFITGQNNSNPFVINAPDSGTLVIGTNGAGSGFTMSGGITLNGNLTLQTFNNTISGTTTARSYFTGNVTGTGNLLLDNLGLAANAIWITTGAVNPNGSITVQGSATGDTLISASIGSNVTGIIQNSATSPLVLSGANTYPGNLTVNAGLVRLSNAPNPLNANTGNDASTVTLAATGATLNLTYAGTDKVDKLVIGSTQQANGTYGKVGSASPVIGISQITGDGTLTVGAVTPPGFSSWITGAFVNGTVPLDKRGLHDDPDNDGISNLIEYAIAGQDPTVGNSAISTYSAGTLSFTKREGTGGLTYDIESSTLLTAGSWTTLPKPPAVESAGSISYSFTPGTPVKNFARLKVTQTP